MPIDLTSIEFLAEEIAGWLAPLKLAADGKFSATDSSDSIPLYPVVSLLWLWTGKLAFSESSLLFVSFRKSVNFGWALYGTVLPIETSFLDSAGSSILGLVLGTITGTTSGLLKTWIFAWLVFDEVLLGTVMLEAATELVEVTFTPEFNPALWGVPGTLPVASCSTRNHKTQKNCLVLIFYCKKNDTYGSKNQQKQNNLHGTTLFSFATGSVFCETDNLPIPAFTLLSTWRDRFPLDTDFDSELPFDLGGGATAYGSTRCKIRVLVRNNFVRKIPRKIK